MSAFPKLPGKPECLGFRKTVVLDLNEHWALNCLLDDAIKFCNDNPVLSDSPTKKMFIDLQKKLNAPTPPAN